MRSFPESYIAGYFSILNILPCAIQKDLAGYLFHIFVVAPKSLGCIRFFATVWTAVRQTSPSFTTSRSLLKLMSAESVMPSSHLILCHPLLVLPLIFPSIRVFSNESALCIRWPKDWSFSISPSNEHPGLISFRMDWLDLLAVQGTLQSLLQHHSSKTSILQCSAFLIAYGYWKHHSFDCIDLCWQIYVAAF